MTIPTLIDKQDGFEIVRDKIAEILLAEIASQKSLATAGGENPALWDIRIFTERSDAWEQWINEQSDTRPICNIWFDDSFFPPGTGNVVSRQKSDSTFNVDLYGYGRSSDDPDGGHVPGDKEATFEAHRALRLVRNILMASEYTYLGLRQLVWRRWVKSRTIFKPEYNGRPLQSVMAARLVFLVEHEETSPQAEATTLEYVSTTFERSETGEVYLKADFDYS